MEAKRIELFTRTLQEFNAALVHAPPGMVGDRRIELRHSRSQTVRLPTSLVSEKWLIRPESNRV